LANLLLQGALLNGECIGSAAANPFVVADGRALDCVLRGCLEGPGIAILFATCHLQPDEFDVLLKNSP
jgi:hypothetical protein